MGGGAFPERGQEGKCGKHECSVVDWGPGVVWRPEAEVWREVRQGRWVEQAALGAMDSSGAWQGCGQSGSSSHRLEP